MRIKLRHPKLIAAACIAAAIWAYLANVTFPLRSERNALRGALAQAEEDVAAATKTLAMLAEFRARAAADAPKEQWAARLLRSIPAPYLVECPVKFLGALRRNGLEGAEIGVTQLLPFPGAPEYAIAKWRLRVPAGRALAFGKSLAALENLFPLGELKELSIRRRDPTGAAEIELAFDMLVRP